MSRASLPVLTSSHAAAFRACARLEYLRYALGYRTARSEGALALGTAIHLALAVWLVGHDMLDALAELRVIVDDFERARAEAMILGYHHRWLTAGLEVLAIEQAFTVPLRNPATGAASRTWQLGGKFDAIVRDAAGRVYVLEHKTTSEDIAPGADYWARLRLDAQASTYLAAARASGYPAEGVIYDMLRKPAIKPLLATPVEARKYTKKTGELYAGQRATDETPDEFRDRCVALIAEDPERYYRRGEVVRIGEEDEDAAYDLWETARAISDGRAAGRAPRNADACMRYGRRCEFLPVCLREGSLESGGFRRVPPDTNEELES